jgi:hypothetical protein
MVPVSPRRPAGAGGRSRGKQVRRMLKSLIAWGVTLGLAGSVLLASGTANAEEIYGYSNTPNIVSASYHMTATGNVAWTVSLNRLVVGDVLAFLAGSLSNVVLELKRPSGHLVVTSVTATSETLNFVSQWPQDSDGNFVALLYLQVQERTTGVPPIIAGITTLSLSPMAVGGLPEVPWAAALPAVGLSTVAAVGWSRRRRTRRLLAPGA